MSCKSQENNKITTPNSFKILDEIEGDLDKDGVSEKVIVSIQKMKLTLVRKDKYTFTRKTMTNGNYGKNQLGQSYLVNTEE